MNANYVIVFKSACMCMRSTSQDEVLPTLEDRPWERSEYFNGSEPNWFDRVDVKVPSLVCEFEVLLFRANPIHHTDTYMSTCTGALGLRHDRRRMG